MSYSINHIMHDFSEWIIRPRLTAAVLKCTQVHLPFIFKGFSPFRNLDCDLYYRN